MGCTLGVNQSISIILSNETKGLGSVSSVTTIPHVFVASFGGTY